MADKTFLVLCLLAILAVGSCLEAKSSIESQLDAYEKQIMGRRLLQESGEVEAQKRCQAAMEAHQYAVDALNAAEENDDSTNITPQMKSLVQDATSRKAGVSVNLLNVFDSIDFAGWANEIFQWILSNNLALPSAQIGEMMYLANTWMDQLANVPQNRTQKDMGELGTLLWSQLWYDYADNLYQTAQAVEDRVSRRGMIMRAVNYYFAAFYPNPTADQTPYRLGKAEMMFNEALSLFTAYHTVNFAVPFNNGTTTANVSGVFATSLPGAKLPLMVFTTSPHNWKEMLFVRYGPGALRRGYAVLFIDGPGTGMTLRTEPFMPVHNNWTAVIDAVLDGAFARSDISAHADRDNVILAGASISGYLTAQACSGMADKLKACVLNPGFVSLADAYNKIAFSQLYRPLMSVALTSPTSFPSEDMAALFRDPVDDILVPLVMDCDESTDAAKLFASGFDRGVLSPTMIHMTMGFLGTDAPADLEEVPDKLWLAFRRVNRFFSGYEINNMKLPVLALVGVLDGLAGDQVQDLVANLPEEAKKLSSLAIFNPETGAALPSQLGAFAVFEQTAYPWLSNVLANGK